MNGLSATQLHAHQESVRFESPPRRGLVVQRATTRAQNPHYTHPIPTDLNHSELIVPPLRASPMREQLQFLASDVAILTHHDNQRLSIISSTSARSNLGPSEVKFNRFAQPHLSAGGGGVQKYSSTAAASVAAVHSAYIPQKFSTQPKNVKVAMKAAAEIEASKKQQESDAQILRAWRRQQDLLRNQEERHRQAYLADSSTVLNNGGDSQRISNSPPAADPVASRLPTDEVSQLKHVISRYEARIAELSSQQQAQKLLTDQLKSEVARLKELQPNPPPSAVLVGNSGGEPLNGNFPSQAFTVSLSGPSTFSYPPTPPPLHLRSPSITSTPVLETRLQVAAMERELRLMDKKVAILTRENEQLRDDAGQHI